MGLYFHTFIDFCWIMLQPHEIVLEANYFICKLGTIVIEHHAIN